MADVKCKSCGLELFSREVLIMRISQAATLSAEIPNTAGVFQASRHGSRVGYESSPSPVSGSWI